MSQKPKLKNLCSCASAMLNKHEAHCPFKNIIGAQVDFSELKEVLEKITKECQVRNQPRDPKRIPKILKRLEKLWKQSPHLRLIQLLENPFPVDGVRNEYYLEDEKLISELEKFYNVKNRQ